MNNNSTLLRLSGMSELDLAELKKEMGGLAVRLERNTSSEDVHGELTVAVAVVTVSLATLRILAAFLMKKRHQAARVIEVEVTLPDGTVQKRKISISSSSSEPPQAQVLKELADICNVDIPAG